MKNKIVLAVVLLLSVSEAQAQVTKYLVKLRNKGDNSFTLANPSAYLSARSIARRSRYGIALDSTDLPVTQRYLDSIASVPGVTILNASKWLNQVSIQTSDPNAISRINAFPFVVSVTGTSFRLAPAAVGLPNKFSEPVHRGDGSTARVTDIQADAVSYGQSAAQIRIHNGQFLHNIGLRGEGMIIGMLDAGYQNYLTVSSLDSARRNGQILGIYDFVARDNSVNEDNAHGEECFSTIAANQPGTFVGTAFHANYFLFRTEDAATETPIEEHNWSCGAERVDSSGGDVISSSLGYFSFDAPFNGQSHPFSDMNGNTTMCAIAADLAAKKGILVCNAAGNEGNSSWGRIITPADGDSVLAVGAVTYAGSAASFTSRGPSADGQVKPDVASVGVQTIIQYPGGSISGGNGTSFATPNLAGLVTCLWQGFPEFNNMRIIDALRQAGSRASNPNDSIGYGIPDVRKALISLTQQVATNESEYLNNCRIRIRWTSKDVSSMRYEVLRHVVGQTGTTTVATVNGSGSTFGPIHQYEITDSFPSVAAGTNLTYTVRQVFDTTASNPADANLFVTLATANGSCITAINTPQLSENSMVLLPNPAHNAAAIRVTLASAVQDVQVQITDAGGKVVYRNKRSLPAGSTLVPIYLGAYASGKYFVTLYGNGQLLGTRELIKL